MLAKCQMQCSVLNNRHRGYHEGTLSHRETHLHLWHVPLCLDYVSKRGEPVFVSLATVTSEGRKRSVLHAIASHICHTAQTWWKNLNTILTHTHTHAQIYTLRGTQIYTHTERYTRNQFHLPLVMPVQMMARLLLCGGPIMFIVVALGMWWGRGWSEVSGLAREREQERQRERGRDWESCQRWKISASEFDRVSHILFYPIITTVYQVYFSFGVMP